MIALKAHHDVYNFEEFDSVVQQHVPLAAPIE